MGNSPSRLPLASQIGSPLQICLNNVFAGKSSAVSYPQDFLYQLLDVKAYNTHIPIVPAAVTRPSTPDEISEILRCATESGVKVQARSGGHSYGNYGLGGEDNAVVVDMGNFQRFSMDFVTWQATIGAGTLLGDVTTRLRDAGGRAIAHGTCPQVGISGHATIGGLGPLSRQWGAALDHVIEVEVVLANGTVTRANSTYNSDVLWAIKGAAASFGIVTEFVFVTHPEPSSVVQYSYTIELGSHSDMWPTFALWQEIVADPALDRQLASEVIVLPRSMIITATYFGTREEYAALNFEQRLAKNARNVVAISNDSWLSLVANWAETGALKLIGGLPNAFYAKSLTFTNTTLIPQAGIQDFFSHLDTADAGTLFWFAVFDLQGGATNDVPHDATAFAHRDTLFYLQAYAFSLTKLSDTSIAFVEGMIDTITYAMPGVDFGAYTGYVDPHLPDGQAKYWKTNLPRLQQIKAAIDPNDLFHNPQSVPVGGTQSESPLLDSVISNPLGACCTLLNLNTP
ncbi:hypothetical protein GGX14DRAFT_651929 [Mycena pura]|uniref:FAD-binding PCMH-type domain-containing protein n=1 Tax=Mycena pura TaxID=153505 RepID=A0AAD6V690_9AGAR|nr:hypothetical protein GGX14DRAFT_651929 [Mycena pura]